MKNLDQVINILKEEFSRHQLPVVDKIEKKHADPYKVLVTTILSARTKDQTVEKAVGKLFDKATNLTQLENLEQKEIETLIFPVGFYKQKAVYLGQLPAVIRDKFGGKIPDGIDDLLQLPGVGRKTANLVRIIAFGKPGVCVDTHVHRICNRWGYVKTRSPLETEMALRKKLPKQYWLEFNSILVSYGQHHCTPRNPKCESCRIKEYCRQIGVKS